MYMNHVLITHKQNGINMSELVEKAKNIAYKAHDGQFRWDGVTPYITHPEIVASNNFSPVDNDIYVATAWLHDVVEDCGIDPIDLAMQEIPLDVINAVVVLTRTTTENYWDYIVRVLDNRIARLVKIADINHNILTVKSKEKLKKYRIALCLLQNYKE